MGRTLYILNPDVSPACYLVQLVAGTIGVDLEVKKIDYTKLKTPEELKKNVQHTVPMLEDGDLCLNESRAIAMYLVSKYGKDDKLYPKDVKKRALVDQRLFFDQELYSRIYAHNKAAYEGKDMDTTLIDRVNDALESLDRMLEGKQWLAGDSVTLADLCVINSLMTIQVAPLPSVDLQKYPNVIQWIPRVKAANPKFEELEKKLLEEIKKIRESMK